jgi:hypothetical protein
MIFASGLLFFSQPSIETQFDTRLLATNHMTALVVDAEGGTTPTGIGWDERVRLGVRRSQNAGFSFELSGDFLYNNKVSPWQVDTITEAMPSAYGARNGFGATLREANVGYRTSFLLVRMGLDTSDWGLGMVANSGSGKSLFGREDGGDRVFRTSVTTMPLTQSTPLYLTIAFDGVVEDDMATLAHGQRAIQGIGSLLYAASTRRYGAYTVYRQQLESDERRATTAMVMDLFGEERRTIGGYDVSFGAEAALVKGTTDRALTYQAPTELNLLGGGAVAKLTIENTKRNLSLHLNGGYASGDANPDDGVVSDFTFDKNFGVGAALFDVAMASIETATYGLLTDPEYSAEPPAGVDGVVTGGSFRRAVYFQPALGVGFGERTDVRVGGVMAWSTVPIAQPFYTFRAGGEAQNHLDEKTAGTKLGDELNWAISHTYKKGTLSVEGAHAWLSADMGGESQGRFDLLMLRLDTKM